MPPCLLAMLRIRKQIVFCPVDAWGKSVSSPGLLRKAPSTDPKCLFPAQISPAAFIDFSQGHSTLN